VENRHEGHAEGALVPCLFISSVSGGSARPGGHRSDHDQGSPAPVSQPGPYNGVAGGLATPNTAERVPNFEFGIELRESWLGSGPSFDTSWGRVDVPAGLHACGRASDSRLIPGLGVHFTSLI